MPQLNPNRTKNQSGERYEGQHKKSGDQHLLPENDSEQQPHRPHRLNREDMQKVTDNDEERNRH